MAKQPAQQKYDRSNTLTIKLSTPDGDRSTVTTWRIPFRDLEALPESLRVIVRQLQQQGD